MKKWTLILFAAGTLPLKAGGAEAAPKNVILMITDGRSFGALDGTNRWRGKEAVYQGRGWTKAWMSTYSANSDPIANPLGYNPAKAWARDSSGKRVPNQDYLLTNATDSASGISAIVSGQKIRDGQLNWSIDGKPVQNFAQIYKAAGRSTGALSTVNWSHATPAGIGSHNPARDDYVGIATEMLTQSGLDVIVGAGNPFFDNNGKPAATPNYRYVGEQNWEKLKDGSLGFALIQSRSEFVALGSAATTPARVCGTFQALSTAQQGREGYAATDVPGSDPRNSNVPTMSEMALAALNVLDNNPKGFFVMMEGGAIDWAAHANQAARLIEEHMEFDAAVEAVSNWVEKNSNWADTLVIITSDHGNGMITGPNGETRVTDNGKGVMPGLKFNSGGHTNELVPLFARGDGADLFRKIVHGKDPVRGNFCDNTDVFRVILTATGVQ